MKLRVTDELRMLCVRILKENLSEFQWAEIESDDMFQAEHFVGGYDATETAFCFSYYSLPDEEYWFQINLDEVRQIAGGTIDFVEMRVAS